MKKHIILAAVLVFSTLLSSAQIITTFAGNGVATSAGDGGPASAASLYNPSGVFQDLYGNTYVVEYTGNRIRKINPAGIISTFAGTGVAGYNGDGIPATNANIYVPIDVIADVAGNVYFVDNSNQRIRKVNTSGIISTVAGTGVHGYSGDGGPATNAMLRDPDRIGMDQAGNLYIADANNEAIRKVDNAGIITTVVGIGGYGGYSGDGGPATAALLNPPLGVAFDGTGNMYIADGYNHVVRKVDVAGTITTFAGNGSSGISGDGGPATAASMMLPGGIAVDAACNVYVTDWYAHNVRKIFSSGTIITVAGNGSPGFSGDGGPATTAQLYGPDNLTFDPAKNLYIADFYNNRVRFVSHLGEQLGACSYVATACDTLTYITVSAISSTSATVTWSSLMMSAGYQYIIDVVPTAPTGAGTGISLNTTPVTGLAPSTTYYAHVRNDCGSGNYSLWKTVAFTTSGSSSSSTCDTITSITVSAVTSNSATVTWPSVAMSAGYQYTVDAVPTDPAGAGADITPNTTPVTGLTPSTAYYAHVRNNCGDGNFSLWKTVPFTTDFATGITNIAMTDMRITAYPSPVANVLYVNADGDIRAAARISLTDIAGKTIKTLPVVTKTTQIDMSALPAGIYLVRYTDAAYTKTIKVTK